MYAVILRYKRPLAEVEAATEGHRAWLKEQYEAGHFLISGPQRPRTGGVILARQMPREDLLDILAGDPFHAKALADYEVIDFAAVSTSADLAFLAEKP